MDVSANGDGQAVYELDAHPAPCNRWGRVMADLPPNKKYGRRDAFHSIALQPLEWITKSLRMGDGWELSELTPFVNRCRALVQAYDDRMKAAGEE